MLPQVAIALHSVVFASILPATLLAALHSYPAGIWIHSWSLAPEYSPAGQLSIVLHPLSCAAPSEELVQPLPAPISIHAVLLFPVTYLPVSHSVHASVPSEFSSYVPGQHAMQVPVWPPTATPASPTEHEMHPQVAEPAVHGPRV